MRTVATAGAVLLVGASASLGAYYGYAVGAHQHVLVGLVFAGAALGGELLKPFAVEGAIDAASRFKIVRAVVCAALAAVCIVYSLAAELSLAAGSRGDLAAARGAIADNTKDVAAEKRRAEAELATLPLTLPVAKIDADIARLMLTPNLNGCEKIDGAATRKVCPKIASLKSDRAIAVRRAELEQLIKASTQTPAAAHVGEADPLAGAVATYANAVGFEWTAKELLPWLALVPVLFLEIGSALALVVVRASGPTQRATAAPSPEPSPAKVDAPATVAEPVQASPRPRDRRAVKGSLVLNELVRRVNGAEGSQRQIADQLGVSKTTVLRAQRSLQAVAS